MAMQDGPYPLDLSTLLLTICHVSDPAERLRRLASLDVGISDLGDRVRRLKRATILELRRTEPLSWADIGALLGVSAQRAEQLSRD